MTFFVEERVFFVCLEHLYLDSHGLNCSSTHCSSNCKMHWHIHWNYRLFYSCARVGEYTSRLTHVNGCRILLLFTKLQAFLFPKWLWPCPFETNHDDIARCFYNSSMLHIYVTLTCVMKTTQNINADVAALPRPGFSSHSDDLKSRLQFSSMTDGGVRKPKWVRGDGDRGERERHATCWLSNLVPYKYGWCWFARHLHPWTMVSFLRGMYIVRVNMIFD